MRFRKKLLPIFVVLGLVFLNTTKAAGIPVIDVAGIAQGVQQILAWREQYKQMTDQLKEATANVNALKDIDASQIGSRGLGEIYNNFDLIPYYSENWRSAVIKVKSSSEYKTSRANYPTSDVPEIDKYNDALAEKEAISRQFFTSSQKRFGQIGQLMSAINSAADPAAKADLSNRIAIERANVAASADAYQVIQRNVDIKIDQASIVRQEAFFCSQFPGAC